MCRHDKTSIEACYLPTDVSNLDHMEDHSMETPQTGRSSAYQHEDHDTLPLSDPPPVGAAWRYVLLSYVKILP
jgi:hypothetical protein